MATAAAAVMPARVNNDAREPSFRAASQPAFGPAREGAALLQAPPVGRSALAAGWLAGRLRAPPAEAEAAEAGADCRCQSLM